MASLVGKLIAKKALKEVSHKNTNSTNPYEEEAPVYGKDGRPTGKVKKRKRGIPTGLSAHDGTVLKKVRRRAYRLDMSLFNCCGIRFGWSSVVGFIPVIGDAIDCLLALLLVKTCSGVEGGLPWTLRSRMLFNIMIDFAVGLVPVVGDLADAMYRANTRNAFLLEAYLTKKAEAEAHGHVSDPELGLQPMPAKPEAARLQSGSAPAAPAATAGVRVQSDPRSGGRPANGKTRRPDEEMAMRAVQFGQDAFRSYRDGKPGLSGQQRGGGESGREAGGTKNDLAAAALRYGVRAVQQHQTRQGGGGRY